MKRVLFALGLISALSVQAQQDSTQTKKDYGKIFGGFESNSQWYLNDKGRKLEHPDDPVRSNNYLLLNYQYKNFTAGIQAEAYEENALLNYNPGFNGTDVALYFVDYKTSKLQLTAGYFYEQFGSGMLLRAWEDRALGINTALRGGRVIYRPTGDLKFTALYGRQRSGFTVANGDIFGFDADANLSSLFKFQKSDLAIGFSYVGRYEKIEMPDAPFDELTNAFSGRINFSHDSFYASAEYNYKSEDGVLNAQSHISPGFVKPGNAILLNLGYSKKGLGIDATVRRVENMLFLSEREPTPAGDGVSTSLNFNDKVMSFIPALTKQHHSLLANIYVYQAQSRVDFIDPTRMKSGETGGQIDIFYNFAKGTFLGGEYGTNVAVNMSSWYNLPGTYRLTPSEYETDLLGVGEKYFADNNLEIKKQFSEKWHTALYYVRQHYNKQWLEGGDIVRTNIIDLEATYNIKDSRSIRFEGEHMWADADKGNWAGATLEYSHNDKLSFYVWNIYNYGNDNKDQQTNYYNVGGAYRIGASRIAFNYGRQRGGLVCVGGVCRFVPESTGFSLSLSTAF